MKTQFIRGVLAPIVCLFCLNLNQSAVGDGIQGPSSTNSSISTGYQCIARRPHSRIWQRAVIQTNQSGLIRTNFHSYTELATGICYLQNGQYVDSVEEIDPVADGAQAIRGQHQVHWMANANAPTGAVTLTTADDKTLTSTVYGLAYYDTASGSNILLAQLQDSTAIITSTNTLVYMNAFSNLEADIRYTYTRAGLSQDIVLHQQPPSPAEYGMAPATTRLEVITEFFDPPTPVALTFTNKGLLNALLLDFGEMQMGPGQTLLIQNGEEGTQGPSVIKEWEKIDDRTFLLEEVPFPAISNFLSSLHSSSIKPDKSRVRRTVMLQPTAPRHISSAKPIYPAKMKNNPRAETSLVVDYNLTGSTNNLTLQGDTTYVVTGNVVVSGTVTIEGGTVVKFPLAGRISVKAPNFVCETAPYRPGVFTSTNDNSVGEAIGSGTPVEPGSAVIYLTYSPTSTNPSAFNNLRFSYAFYAIEMLLGPNGINPIKIQDCQFLHCFNGCYASPDDASSNGPSCILDFYNDLFSQCNTAISEYYDGTPPNFTNAVVNVTADGLSYFCDSSASSYATNCVFTAVTNLNVTSSTDCVTNGTGTGVYQAVGAASYYLANGSTNRAAGTVDIDSNLLTDLRSKTTYPPTNITGWITNNLTLSNNVPRDTNELTVDLGYHYDALDYAVSIQVSNAVVMVQPGTAIAAMGALGGVSLIKQATFNSQGTATAPNFIVQYNTVQEQSNTNWESTGSGSVLFQTGGYGVDTPTPANFEFTAWSVLGGSDAHLNCYVYNSSPITMENCSFYNGNIWADYQALLVTNCLFQRVNSTLLHCPSNSFYNNLFDGGEFTFLHSSGDGGDWIFRDNFFDGTSITNQSSSTIDICSNNAYVTTNLGYLPPTNGIVVLTTNPVFEIGTLGQYYYPATLTNLIHAGSRLASAAGLYHYTVTTDNAIEGTNAVSIGFHYVATDVYGNPLDANSNGIPDYLEDSNGDGLVDDGETNWTLAVFMQPQSTNVVQGQNATFSVGVSGIEPFYYQWQSNGIAILNATNASFTNMVVTTNNAASYSVVLSNIFGTLVSSSAVLSVTVPLSIATQPTNLTVLQGHGGTFHVVVNGNYPSYQWYSNSTAMTLSSGVFGVQSSSLMLGNVIPSEEVNYYVVITNLFGSVTSSIVTLTVITPPGGFVSPTNPVAVQASDVTFGINVTNSPPVYFQWWFTNLIETNEITGAITSNYTQLVVQTNNAGYYAAIVTNAAGSTNISTELTVIVPPWITQQPASITNNQGSTASFSVVATGTTNLTYQWYGNGTNLIPDATSTNLVLTNVQTTNAAGYSVVVSNSAGTNMSAWAWLSVASTNGGGTNYGWPSGSAPPTTNPIISMFGPTNTFATNPAVYIYTGTNPGPISIRASAKSTYSYITSVAFYSTGTNNVTNTGTDFRLAGDAVPGSNTTFALAWTNALPGTNVLKARAWDLNNLSNDSAPVYVVMAQAPTVSATPSSIVVILTNTGMSTNINFVGNISNDGVPFTQITNILWSVTSTNSSSTTISNTTASSTTINFAAPGIYTVQFQVDNHFATSHVTCTVIVDQPPTINFNSPTNNSTFIAGNPVVLKATPAANYPATSITNVLFLSGTNQMPAIQTLDGAYDLAWSDPPLWTNPVYAVAWDNYGASNTTSINVAIVPKLALFFISPTNNQLFINSPADIFLTALPISYVGAVATGVTFSNQTQSINLGPGILLTNNAYQYRWQGATNGTYTLAATATDNAGNHATNTITIIVNAMPTIYITNITNFQSFREVTNATITAVASDSDGGVANVQFYKYFPSTNNSLGSFTTSGSTVTNSVVWSNLTAGNYPIVAVATDNRGAQAMSSITSFTVTSTNPPPFLQLNFPTNDSVFVPNSDITIQATAYTLNTNPTVIVTNVEFFIYENDIGGSEGVSNVYSITECCWEPGIYTITAVASDTDGMVAVATNQITIAANLPTAQGFWDIPFSISADSLEAYYGAGTLVPIMGLAADSSGTLYVQGQFNVFSSTNETNWTAIDPGYATLASILSSGTNVYVGGIPAGDTVCDVYTWTNGNWEELGNGLNGYGPHNICEITAMATIGGNIYVAGTISSDGSGNTNVQGIARLDQANHVWLPVGNGITNGFILAIAAMGNEIYIGGTFTAAGGDANANYIARLTGNIGTNVGSWTNLGSGLSLSASNDCLYPVTSLAVCGTNLYVGGEFTMAGGDTNAHGVAVWNTLEWRTLNGGPGSPLGSDPFYNYGEGVLGGYDTAPFHVWAVSAHGNSIYVGGDFTNVTDGSNSIFASCIAVATWSENEQVWSWSDLDYGVANQPGDELWVSNIRLVNGAEPGSYDVYALGGFTAVGSAEVVSGDWSSTLSLARWRVGYPHPASLPIVEIKYPTSPDILTNPSSIYVCAIATSDYTNINSANFYFSSGPVGSQFNYPSSETNYYAFTNEWSNPPPGLYLVKAQAVDDGGLIGVSTPLVINIKSATNAISANDDYYTIPVGTLSTNLQLLDNDSPSNGLNISGLTVLHNDLGTLAVSFDRKYVTFTPFPNTSGTNIFYYTVTNSSSNVDSASVTLNILAPPQVMISSPSDQERIPSSVAPLTISGNSMAVGPGNAITNMQLLVLSTNNISSNSQASSGGAFSFNWTNSTPGWYTFIAVASDLNGTAQASTPVTISLYNTNASLSTVTALITNLAPIDTDEGDFSGQLDPVITNGIFDLRGKAFDSVATNPVSYKVLLFQPSSGLESDTGDTNELAADYASSGSIFADITPGPLNLQGSHIGGDSNGDLGSINLTGVPNGTYELVLQVRGGTDVTNTLVEIQLNSQLKIGQFNFNEQDLVLPVSGIPLTITRTYNSMNPVNADFGYNWTFALNSMNIQLDEQRESVPQNGSQAPFSTSSGSQNGLPTPLSVRTGGGWDVTITLPNGKTAMFQCNFITDDLGIYTPSWTAPPGINYMLTDPNNDRFYSLTADSGWNNKSDLAFNNFDIPSYLLTDNTTGIQYSITRGTGSIVSFDPDDDGNFVYAQVYGPPTLASIIQPSGDHIDISSNSIAHYAPGATSPSRAISLVRDGHGRITAVFDPNSTNGAIPMIKYVYDEDNGNLIQVWKLVNSATLTYTTNLYDYNNPAFPHYITSMENGDGVTVARNFYDNTGRVIAIEDANGNFTRFVHNVTNTTELIIDPLNNTNAYSYDLNGNIISETNALGQITTMGYDANNNKTSSTTYLSGLPYATTTSVYDQNLNLPLSTTDPLGHTTSFTYNNIGELLTTTDARGNKSTNNYDSAGNLTNSSDALGNVTENSYAGGVLRGSTDPLFTTATNFYDANQNLMGTATFDVANNILSSNSFTYDADGNRLTSTVWRHASNSWIGATTQTVYDAQNRVIATIDADGGTNAVVYDGAGHQIATTDPLGRITSYGYDYMGRLVQTTYPDLTAETSAYDANGNRTNSVDKAGRLTVFGYDGLNRLTNTIYADLTTNSTVYDSVGRVQETIDGRGIVTGYAYDVAGRRLGVTNAVGTSAAMTNLYSYDANGNQLTVTDTLERTTTNVFDALNRQIQTLFADGTQTSVAYDVNGRRIATTNQDGIATLFGYDGAGRLVGVTNALNQATRYQYDEAGNETNQIDALGRTNVFAYDGQGRRVQHSMPGGQTEAMVYDLDGNMAYQTNFNGAIITNQYDLMNRLTNVSSISGYNVAYAYTLTGQRSMMVDASGTTTNGYDNRERLLVKSVTWVNGTNVLLNYRYDADGNLTNLWSSTVEGVSNVYQYDALNRLTSVQANGSSAATYSFDQVGNFQSGTFGSGVTNLYQYDKLNRLTTLVWKLNTVTLACNYYQLGLTGNRTNLIEIVGGTSRTYAWQYDQAYRLTNENISGFASVGYGLDAVGNRLSRSGPGGQTNTFNSNDWLTNDTYDNNGNTLGSSGTNYEYDVLNRITNMNSGAVVVVYDGDGNRASKTVGGTTTYYLVDDKNPTGYAQVLEERTGSGGTATLSRVYNYGMGLVNQRVAGTGAVYYYGMDGRGSVRFLTDTNGSITNTYTYDAYGNLIASTGSLENAYLYCGEQFDSDLKMYYLRARYLSPVTGRFWTADTFEGEQKDPLSLHKYLYGSDNPVNRTDPGGHDSGLDSMPNISSALFSHLVADIAVAAISSGDSTPTDDIVWNPGLGGKHAQFIIVRGIPPNSWTFTAPNLETFSAPNGTDFKVEYNAGVANGMVNFSGINDAVGTYGKFDFQRNMGRGQQPDGPYNYFYPAYVHASNYGVGVFMNGCGFSLNDTIRIANTFAHGESRNAGDPQQKDWWTQGWEAAHIGAYNGLGLPHLF